MSYKIQSVLIPLSFGIDKAIEYLNNNNYKFKKVDISKNYFRFRQLEPSYLKKIGFNQYHNKKLNNGVVLVIVY